MSITNLNGINAYSGIDQLLGTNTNNQSTTNSEDWLKALESALGQTAPVGKGAKLGSPLTAKLNLFQSLIDQAAKDGKITTEQQTEFTALLKKIKEDDSQMMAGAVPPPPPMNNMMGMSSPEDMIKNIASIEKEKLTSFQTDIQTLKQSGDLTAEQEAEIAKMLENRTQLVAMLEKLSQAVTAS